MKVLIIPEDFRNDQYTLKPLFLRLFRAIGRRRVHVQICRDPLLGGIGEALKSQRIHDIVKRYRGMVDIFILCVDRDGDANRRQRLDQIEAEFSCIQTFFAENAWEELETWILAGLSLPDDWRWNDVRTETDVKEKYFRPLVTQRSLSDEPGGGRKTLAKEASHRIDAIRQKCTEDFDALAQRLESAVP